MEGIAHTHPSLIDDRDAAKWWAVFLLWFHARAYRDVVSYRAQCGAGVISFSSEVGAGTCFTARIPLRLLPSLYSSPEAHIAAEAPQLPRLPQKTAALLQQVPSCRGVTAVLLVPRASLRSALARVLRRAGATVDDDAVGSLGWLQQVDRSAFGAGEVAKRDVATTTGAGGRFGSVHAAPPPRGEEAAGDPAAAPRSRRRVSVEGNRQLLTAAARRAAARRRTSLSEPKALSAQVDKALSDALRSSFSEQAAPTGIITGGCGGEKAVAPVMIVDVSDVMVMLDAGVELPRPGVACLVLGRTEDLSGACTLHPPATRVHPPTHPPPAHPGIPPGLVNGQSHTR